MLAASPTAFDLQEVAGVAAAGQRRRRRGTELGPGAEQVGGDPSPAGLERGAERRRGRDPHPGPAPRRRVGDVAGVLAGPEGQQGRRGRPADRDAAGLGRAVGDLDQRARQGLVQGVPLLGIAGRQHRVRGRGHRGHDRLVPGRPDPDAVGAVAAGDRVGGLEHRRLDQGQVVALVDPVGDGRGGQGGAVPVHHRLGPGPGRRGLGPAGGGRGRGRGGEPQHPGQRRRDNNPSSHPAPPLSIGLP